MPILNVQGDEKTLNTPYESNISFIGDILFAVRLKAYLYFKTSVNILNDSRYSLKNDLFHFDDFDGILNDAFTDEDYREYGLCSKETAEYIRGIRSRARLSIKSGVDIPLERLFLGFDFDDFEIHCFILALAVKLDRDFERIYSCLQLDAEARYLTVDLAVKMYFLDEGSRLAALSYFSAKNKLCDYFFSDVSGCGSFPAMGLNLRKGFASFALNGYDEEIVNNVASKPAVQNGVAEEIEEFYRGFGKRPGSVLNLIGERGLGKTLQIARFCEKYGLRKADIKAWDLEECSSSGTCTPEELIKDGIVRCVLESGILCFDNICELKGKDCEERINKIIASAIRDYGVPTIITSREPITERHYAGIQIFEVTLPLPNAEERMLLWRHFLSVHGGFEDIDLDLPVSVFEISPGRIEQAVENAYWKARSGGEQRITQAGLMEAVYGQIRRDLQTNAVRISTDYDWDSLIIPDYQKGILDILCGQIKNKWLVYEKWGFGKERNCAGGISVLFSGPPGTGKTMAARVVTKRMGLELYRVDLSRVVSKYIGETEKNLELVFEGALKTGAVLLFDEADALFGKRTAVRDSHDRNANMEVSYLLQKMEEYDGIVILTTNLSSNFDDAYRRRLKFIVEFPFPDEDLRLRIWKGMFTEEAPVDSDIDYDFLARKFHLSGGNIKNIAVNAAFIAAGQMTNIDMGCVIKALRIELGKGGKILSRDDLDEYGFLL